MIIAKRKLIKDILKIGQASGTSLTLSEEGQKRFYSNLDKYKKKIILRPQEISNNPEIIGRIGSIAMNTAIEVDICSPRRFRRSPISRFLSCSPKNWQRCRKVYSPGKKTGNSHA